MATDNERKRKRKHREPGEGVRPAKKTVVENSGAATITSSAKITISHVRPNDIFRPVIATTSAGTNFPTVSFSAFTKPATDDPYHSPLLLHSSQHPRLDYTAEPDLNPHLRHYVGIFDPSTSTVQIVPSQTAALRNALRSELAEVTENDIARTFAKQREDLGKEFGTKKAKRMIASRVENAINAETGKDVQAAVLGSVDAAAENLPVRQDLNESILASKPIPRPNLDAQTVADVYPVSVLVPSGDLRNMTVKEWQDAVAQNQEVRLTSRFVANRLQAVASSNNVMKLKALKYMLLLLNFNDALQPTRGGKKLPQRDQFKSKLSEWPETLIDSTRRRFAEGSELNKWHLDNFMTHIAALSLYIDDWRTDTHDLKEDLRLDVKQLSQYFSELGCKVAAPTEKERLELKITNKALAAQKRLAKLRLPLDFPRARLPPKRR